MPRAPEIRQPEEALIKIQEDFLANMENMQHEVLQAEFRVIEMLIRAFYARIGEDCEAHIQAWNEAVNEQKAQIEMRREVVRRQGEQDGLLEILEEHGGQRRVEGILREAVARYNFLRGRDAAGEGEGRWQVRRARVMPVPVGGRVLL